MFRWTKRASEDGWGRSAVRRLPDGLGWAGLGSGADPQRSGTYGSVLFVSCNSLLPSGVAASMLLCFAAARAVLWSLVGHRFHFALEWLRQQCSGVYSSIVFCNSVLANRCGVAAPKLRR